MDPAVLLTLGHLGGRKAGVHNTRRVRHVLEPEGMTVC